MSFRFSDRNEYHALTNLASAMPGLRIEYDESDPTLLKVAIPSNALSAPELAYFLPQDIPSDPFAVAALVACDRPLYPHQAEAALWLLDNRGGLLADDMGVGKTAAAAVAAMSYKQWRGDLAATILIVGPSYVESVWRRELAELGFLDDPKQMAVARGTSPYEKNLEGNLDSGFLFVPYHLIGDWGSFCRMNRTGKPIAIIMDEAHWAKNAKSKRGLAAANASKLSEFRVLLTGTPMSNRPSELWNVLSALDGTGAWGSHFEFRVRYCGAMHIGHGYKDMGPTRTEELRTRMDARYLRRNAEDVGLNLPTFRRETLMVTPDQRMRDNHNELMEGYDPATLLKVLQEHKLSNDVLRKMTKLRKYTSRCKVDATVDLVQECQSQGQSCVVFAWEKAIVNRLAKKLNGFVVHGDIELSEREARVDRFQAEGGVLVATLDSLKEGVTLTKANRVIMHDLSWVPSDILQAEARVNRIGQTKPVISTWMLMEDSFDVLLAVCLTEKGQAIADVLGIEEAQSMAGTFAAEDIAGLMPAVVDAKAMIQGWIGRIEK